MNGSVWMNEWFAARMNEWISGRMHESISFSMSPFQSLIGLRVWNFSAQRLLELVQSAVDQKRIEFAVSSDGVALVVGVVTPVNALCRFASERHVGLFRLRAPPSRL